MSSLRPAVILILLLVSLLEDLKEGEEVFLTRRGEVVFLEWFWRAEGMSGRGEGWGVTGGFETED